MKEKNWYKKQNPFNVKFNVQQQPSRPFIMGLKPRKKCCDRAVANDADEDVKGATTTMTTMMMMMKHNLMMTRMTIIMLLPPPPMVAIPTGHCADGDDAGSNRTRTTSTSTSNSLLFRTVAIVVAISSFSSSHTARLLRQHKA